MYGVAYIVGPLGSGKTRLAQLLAATVPNAAFLGLDRLDEGTLETAPEGNWSWLTLARRLIAEGAFEEAAERLLQGVERAEAAPGLVFLSDFRSVHILAGSWNEATGQQLQQVLERVEASRKNKTSVAC